MCRRISGPITVSLRPTCVVQTRVAIPAVVVQRHSEISKSAVKDCLCEAWVPQNCMPGYLGRSLEGTYYQCVATEMIDIQAAMRKAAKMDVHAKHTDLYPPRQQILEADGS